MLADASGRGLLANTKRGGNAMRSDDWPSDTPHGEPEPPCPVCDKQDCQCMEEPPLAEPCVWCGCPYRDDHTMDCIYTGAAGHAMKV
jgi:hypothetical protein